MLHLATAGIGRALSMARRPNRRLDRKTRDALELLTAASPGCPEPLLLAHGLTRELLAGLVRRGLATAQTESLVAGARGVEIVCLKITEAGRRALRD